MTPRKIAQTFNLLFFVILLVLTTYPLHSFLTADVYLQMDPLIFSVGSIASRSWLSFWLVFVLLCFLTVILGRFFCGWICPLGITLDSTDALLRSGGVRIQAGRENRFKPHESLRPARWLILSFITGASVCGLSLLFAVSPLSLITRFYGMVLYPIICLLADTGLTLIRPSLDTIGLEQFSYAKIPVPRYSLQWFTVFYLAAIFLCGLLTPRFWCRYLCPSGAIFSLLAIKPVWRRRVNEKCIQCGACRQKCPMAAIPEDPLQTDHNACIVCQKCSRNCPAAAIRFSFRKIIPALTVATSATFSTGRRKLIFAGLGGICTAGISITDLTNVYGRGERNDNPGTGQIRPPGAVSEARFLSLCIRCGTCMKACPTNTLQPLGISEGLAPFFSPRITPLRGPCEPDCNICGQVCPTGAIRSLSKAEKMWAKVGSARVIRDKCLAWELNRKCLICDEVCPYDAISFSRVEGIQMAVPFVDEFKCTGCGFCEHFCPVRANPAIQVEPMLAARLDRGSYVESGKTVGLRIQIAKRAFLSKDSGGKQSVFSDLPPGFTE